MRNIVASLEEALEQMEHVLELVELAEEQKLGDEREIESLRRMLRRIQLPRGEQPRREEPRREQPRRYDEPRQEEPRRYEEPPREQESHEEHSRADTGPEEQGS